VKRWWPILALLLSVGLNVGLLIDLALSSPAVTRRQQEALRPAGAGRLQQLADHVGLQGPARRRFVQRQRRFFAETTGPRARLPEIRREVRSELTRPAPDRARLDALLHEAADTYLRLEQAVVDNVLDSRALLAPEQEHRYVDLISRLALEGPGQMGRLKPAQWPWWWRLHPPQPTTAPFSPLDRDQPARDRGRPSTGASPSGTASPSPSGTTSP
jgi:hypothetical protein